MLNYMVLLFCLSLAKFSLSQLEDNLLATCSNHEFTCGTGECIHSHHKCDGYDDCLDGSDEKLLVCANYKCPLEIGFQCSYGGCIELEKKCDGSFDCSDQSDEDQLLCGYSKPISTGCKQPKVQNANCKVINCTTGVQIRKCSDYMDTRNICIELTSYTGYVLDEYKVRFISRCIDDEWNPQLPKCQECGVDNRITLSIIKGQEVSRPVPWHAGLYRMEGGEASYKCGGTIVHSKAVITAAHCVIDFDNLGGMLEKFPRSELRVTAGKMFQNYSTDEKYQQKFKVVDIRITDYRSSHKNDIAILMLNKKIIPNPDVIPICLGVPSDYNNWESLQQGPHLRGTVVGWGKTDDGKNSEILKEAAFNVCCNYTVCRRKVPLSYILMVTEDKFCVEVTAMGISVEKGDSGGGFIITNNNRHYLYGIVSVRADEMRLFTLFAYHSRWAFENLNVV